MKLKPENSHKNPHLEETLNFVKKQNDEMIRGAYKTNQTKYTRFKSAAVTNRTSMTRLINQWIDAYLEEQAKL